MRPTFLLNEHHTPVSALVNRDQEGALSVGINIELVKDYHNEYGRIPAGTKGFVDYVDRESGQANVHMEGSAPALIQWENTLVLFPFTTDDLTACLVCNLSALAGV